MYLPLILILNCLFIYLFRNKFNTIGIFVSSIISYFVTICYLAYILYYSIFNSCYIFIDYGRWFYVYDLIDLNFIFVIDYLSLISTLLVLILTLVAQIFGIEYMYREAFAARLLYLLNMFATSVIYLFFVFDFFLILIVWELIGLFSLLLVNFYSTRIYTLKAAYKTFFFSRVSDFFISTLFFIIILFFNTTDLSLIFLQTPFLLYFNIYIFEFGFNILNIISVFLVIAGGIKAAQFFSHVWLPDAMEAPTPASALIHSSTLVIMGIYLIIRCSIFFELSLIANYVLICWGGLTIAVGSVSAAFQNDIKKLVAYSTISQMGYLFCGCGFLCYSEVLFYLIIHALNKAFLFILVGYIVHFFLGNTDMRLMGSSYSISIDFVFLLFFLNLNLSGLPFSAGFLAKEFLIFQTIKDEFILNFLRVFWLISFLFTPFYMFYMSWNVFFRGRQSPAKLTSTNKIFFFFTPLTYLQQIQNIYFNSRLSSIIYLFFFIIIIFYGETLILILNEFGFSTNLNHLQLWNYTNFFISEVSFNAAILSINLIFYLVLISLIVITRLFINFLYISI